MTKYVKLTEICLWCSERSVWWKICNVIYNGTRAKYDTVIPYYLDGTLRPNYGESTVITVYMETLLYIFMLNTYVCTRVSTVLPFLKKTGIQTNEKLCNIIWEKLKISYLGISCEITKFKILLKFLFFCNLDFFLMLDHDDSCELKIVVSHSRGGAHFGRGNLRKWARSSMIFWRVI